MSTAKGCTVFHHSRRSAELICSELLLICITNYDRILLTGDYNLVIYIHANGIFQMAGTFDRIKKLKNRSVE